MEVGKPRAAAQGFSRLRVGVAIILDLSSPAGCEMSRRYRPAVLDGLLSAQDENRIWADASAVSGLQAPPITGWLLASSGHWQDKRWMSRQIARMLGMSHKAWESGLPKTRQKRERVAKIFAQTLEATLAQTEEICAARRLRGVERTFEQFRASPATVPCTSFSQTLGIAGGDALEQLAKAFDDVSRAIATKAVPRSKAPALVIAAAQATGVISRRSVNPDPRIDPGLDAMLVLMARLDRDWAQEVCAHRDRVSSVFSLLIDMPGGKRPKRSAQRLLDIYYAFVLAAKGRSLPARLPSIDQLERALLKSVPASGAQSPIVRWRNGSQHLRGEQIEAMSMRLPVRFQASCNWYFRFLWSAAALWSLIEQGRPEATRIAGERYALWWQAMHSEGRRPAALTHPYWLSFQPHA